MLKPIGPNCNLDCEYCYYKYKDYLYPSENHKMSLKMLKKFTIHYLRSRKQGEVVFGWQGGEPTLLGLDFFKKAISYQKKYGKKGINILNTLQTNGTLLNNEWGKFLHDNEFLVGISIDGPPKYHDFYRKDHKGKKSSPQVIRGLKYLKKHNVEYNILACVHEANQDHPLEVYKYFRDELGVDFIQFIPIVERKRVKKPLNTPDGKDSKTQRKYDIVKQDELYPFSVDSKKYGEFLYEIFKEWVQHDVGKVFIQIFDTTLSAFFPTPPGLCCFSKECGNALVMEYNGDIYTCDHFVEPEYKVGNINDSPLLDIVTSKKQIKFGKSKNTTLPKKCKDCKVRFICNGGCLRNRIINTSSGESTLNYLCEGYKYFFKKSIPYMKFMAQLISKRKPAAEIMKYIKENSIKEFDKEIN